MKLFCVCGHDRKSHLDDYRCIKCNCETFERDWSRKKSIRNSNVEVSKIFSGDDSRKLWEMIDKLYQSENSLLYETLYLLGCKLQELESKYDKLMK